MTMIIQDRFAPPRLSVFASLGRWLEDLGASRQKQADKRVATYLRGLPDHVIRNLGVPPAEMEKLGRCSEAQPRNLYGRVTVMSVVQSARFGLPGSKALMACTCRSATRATTG